MTKRKVWRWFLGTVAAMGAVAGLVVLDAHRRASAAFERHERDAAARIAAIRAREWARPSVFGEGIPGNAWEHYRTALTAIKAIPESETNLIPEIARDFLPDEVPDDEIIGLFYEAYGPEMEGLRRGARSIEVNPGYPYERLHAWKFEGSGEAIRAARFLAGAAAYQYRMGNDREALELGVLGLAMGQDVARGGFLLDRLIQIVVEQVMVESLRPLFEDVTLRASELQRFMGQLDLLERTRPSVREIMEVENLYSLLYLLRMEWSEMKSPFDVAAPAPRWRCLFSRKLTRAQALGLASGLYGELEGVYGRPIHERASLMERAERHSACETNPLTDKLIYCSKLLRREAAVALDLTLLRVAAALAWHEAEKGARAASLEDLVPRYLSRVPSCPYTGTPLRYKDGRVWSIGGDGKDDGGACDEIYRGDIDHAGSDVVWTVKRKQR